MRAKRTLIIVGSLLVVVASITAVASARTAPSKVSAVIRHQVRGCHTWSFDGGTYKASQAIVLRRGGWLTVTNNDVMPHALVKMTGPTVRFVNVKTGVVAGGMGSSANAAPGAMTHMGASTKVFFAKPGVYRFVTKAGEDYPAMSDMKTVGEDNTLRLTVTVA